ncbi:MAG: helix-turn-helix transcriptional regulator [Richelia sp. RM2_1_2]|nr:helix-turn-helix transcriptional regulator [Richelia sp. RM1_1_1]NJO63248.1 helix-turn-helix transcriptional regulator [Richelia sp. RM2_1_2]
MIKNDLEYDVTLSWVNKMGRAIAMLERDEEKKNNDPDIWQIHYDGVTSQRQDLLEQVTEYEALIAHNPKKPIVLQIESMDELSDLLIKARIAFKITQQELAALCHLTTEEIQLFEDKDYQNASYVDFLAVANALGVEIVDGKFIAKLDDFFRQKLAHIRLQSNLDEDMKAAS